MSVLGLMSVTKDAPTHMDHFFAHVYPALFLAVMEQPVNVGMIITAIVTKTVDEYVHLQMVLFFSATTICITDPGCSDICAHVDGIDTCFCMAGLALGADNLTCAGLQGQTK